MAVLRARQNYRNCVKPITLLIVLAAVGALVYFVFQSASTSAQKNQALNDQLAQAKLNSSGNFLTVPGALTGASSIVGALAGLFGSSSSPSTGSYDSAYADSYDY